MKTLLLKLSGPLQSYGTDSRFETRHTDYYPSKSAVVGMIAAALGYRRHETEKIQQLNELDFAVRIDHQGRIIKDYHIAQKYKESGIIDRTYVTNRYYLEDAVFIVGISHHDESFVDRIYQALQAPYFQMFMGRRSLPLVGDYLLDSTATDVMTALEETTWQGASWMVPSHQATLKLPVYADGDLLSNDAVTMRRDHVISFDQRDRRFTFRAEKSTDVLVDNPYFKEDKATEHDAFHAVGGS